MPAIDLVSQYELKAPGISGKTIVTVRISYGPGAATPPHRHGGCAVTGYVVSGTILNKMNDEPMKVIETGGAWYEAPGCHHRISDNASTTEDAVVLASMVVDTDALEKNGMGALMQIDPEYL
jgi:quercetin dioxygenase-like cupin family protein